MMRRVIILSAVLALLFLGYGTTFSQSRPVKVDIFVDAESLRIGDPLEIILEIKRFEDFQVMIPDMRITLVPLELGDPVIDRSKEDDYVVERLNYIAFAFDTGYVVIPSQPILYWDRGDTSFKRTAYTDSLFIYVQSVLTPDAQDIRDIKEPFTISPPFKYWWYLLGLLLVAAAAAAVYYYLRKREGKPVVPFVKPKKIRPAHEIALEALKSLWADKLLEKGDVDGYYVELSRVLREYIENRYFIAALEMTTAELLEVIESKDIDDVIASTVRSILNQSDLVKFARYRPDQVKSTESMVAAVDIVEKTKIVPKPEEPKPDSQDIEVNQTVESESTEEENSD